MNFQTPPSPGGGGHLNSAIFSGSLANYTLTATGNSYVISDNTRVDSTVTHTNIYSLTFSDATVQMAADLTTSKPDGSTPYSLAQFTDTVGQRLEQFYLAYYGRSADYAGLVYWKQTLSGALGNDQTKMVGYFGNAGQTEFVNLYGTGNDNAAFLTAVYQNLFSHGPDTAGLDYWVSVVNDAVAKGTTLEAARANAVLYIVDGAKDSDVTALNNKIANMTTISQQIATYDLSNSYGTASNAMLGIMRDWTQAQTATTNSAPALVVRAVTEKAIATAAVGGNEVQTSASYTLPTGFANLKLTGTTAITGTGNTADNLIYGNAAGSTLTGGGGNDCFVVTSLTGKPDRIADFATGDMIAVDTAALTGLKAGVQTVQTYGSITGTKATLAYDQTTGTLYFDADGTGTQAAQAILTLTGNPTLTAGSVWGI